MLLGKRSATVFRAGYWCLPGGHVEFEEDFLTAARRETREETGLEVDGILSVVSNYLSPAFHSLVIVLLAHPVSGEARGGDDIEAVAWFGPDELPELAFEADGHIVKRYLDAPFACAPVDPRFSGASDL